MTIPIYDLSQSYLIGTLEPNHPIAKVDIQVNGKTVNVVSIPSGTQTLRVAMAGEIPTTRATITLLPEDTNGYIWQYQVPA
ncbi:hypothetical protein HCA69_08550 [Listeria grandensis]|uniref:Uncharacterized protein n=1 Tax=Listeria grandensis TaxID=1494963 RepID=A0A7X1CPW7_9LIST|nr:hypothetical protein [Listeria grandensis]MBC1936412.1 hypothetical protein [Listeria grandensis]